MPNLYTTDGATIDQAAIIAAFAGLNIAPGTVAATGAITGIGVPVTKFCTTQFDAVTGTTGVTLTNIVGLTAFDLVAAGVYKWEVSLSGVCTTNGGIKLGLKLTTATLTTLESMATLHAAASTATAHVTSTTDQASLVASVAAAWLGVRISGMLVVNAAGTVALQAAQNTAHADTTSVYVGSSMTLTRIS